MNYNFILFFIFALGLIPIAYADYRGIDYLYVDNGDGTYTQTLGLPKYILENGVYVPYVQNDNSVTSYIGTVTLNPDGSFSWENKFTDQIVAKYADISNQTNWVYPNSLNGASPSISFQDGTFVSSKTQTNVGRLDYKYIFTDGEWKTQLEATNLSSLETKVFGFDQIIDLNSDRVKFGNSIKNLDNFDGVMFDREILDANEAKVLGLLNGVNFDFGFGYDDLYSVTVYDTGINSSRLVFDYRTDEILMPDQTLIIDPTFSEDNPNEDGFLKDADNDEICDSAPSSILLDTTSSDVFVGIPSASGSTRDCYRGYFEYDLSSLPNGITVSNTEFIYQVNSLDGSGAGTCDYRSLSNQPSTRTDPQKWADINSGTVLVTSDTKCDTVGNNKTIDLGTTADSEIESRVHNGDWYAIAMIKTNDVGSSTTEPAATSLITAEEGTGTPDPTLQITYSILQPDFDVTLSNDNVGDMVLLAGNVTINDGWLVNVTSIVYSINGTTQNTNSTIQNTTSYPTLINFGPFYSQQTSDSIFNHTVSVQVQDFSFDSFSNSSSSLITREYDPNYFTALDPTQGLVNYTFVGNYIQVNRDKNASQFDIECQYFTQAQAFLNELELGVWDNNSNTYYYRADTSGYYYAKCFNDGELFVTAIPQNFSNALIPGLIIFDQLGGFFGAPSIILVVLSILSLGTGRNYPIILLIAASVTGILLSLELLTLDPGLVVALIVMAGIGLFGIRKFY